MSPDGPEERTAYYEELHEHELDRIEQDEERDDLGEAMFDICRSQSFV